MISSSAYVFILITLAIAFLILTATLVMLIRRKSNRDLAETFKILLPTISSIFDNPFFWIDIDGKTINFINENASILLGFSLREAQTKDISIIMADDFDIRNSSLIKEGGTLIKQTSLITKDGRKIPIEISILAINTSSGDTFGYAMIAEDLHEKEQALLKESAAQYKQSLIATEKNMAQLFSKCNELTDSIKKIFATPNNDFEDALKKITQELHNIFDSYLSILWLSGDNEEELRLAGQWGLSDVGFEKFKDIIPTEKKILKSIEQKTIILEDVTTLSGPVKNFLAEEGVSFIAEIPFFENSHICGIIEIYIKSKDIEIKLYRQLLNHIAELLTALRSVSHAKIISSPEFKSLSREKEENEKKLNEKIEICERDLKELKQLQQLTIGRELRMVDLKKKIDILEEELESCKAHNNA